jgi:RNA polymerase sigma-70 factor (ECF subfamily)
MHKSDEELIELFSVDSEKAFNLIVKKFQERLYWHIRKIVISHDDADDVLQNTFIKAWKAFDKFENKSKLYTWFYRIATNESITFINLKKKKQEDTIEDYQNELGQYIESDPFFDGDELQLQLQKAVLSLPEKQRLVFNMKYFDDLKYSEIAEILDITEGSLKASYHLAVKKIETYFK